MRTLNKKLMTLACATCLTVGMGAVACADTVDLVCTAVLPQL